MADVPNASNVPEELTENSAELRFPKEFEDQDHCQALLNSEVYALLDRRKQQNESAEDVSKPDN